MKVPVTQIQMIKVPPIMKLFFTTPIYLYNINIPNYDGYDSDSSNIAKSPESFRFYVNCEFGASASSL